MKDRHREVDSPAMVMQRSGRLMSFDFWEIWMKALVASLISDT